MTKLLSIVCFAVLSCSTSKQVQIYKTLSVDSLFVCWNKVTFESLYRQKRGTTDSLMHKVYDNRILSSMKLWKIDDTKDTANNSIRFDFLKTISATFSNKKSDFYIIEANESGSKVAIRNFLFHKNLVDIVDVEVYDFFNSSWQKTAKYKINNFVFQADLATYLTEFGKGFNYNDIIITEFKNGQVQQSVYYLYSTLSKESKINEILGAYKKENFVK